jgi:hypothetical protein
MRRIQRYRGNEIEDMHSLRPTGTAIHKVHWLVVRVVGFVLVTFCKSETHWLGLKRPILHIGDAQQRLIDFSLWRIQERERETLGSSTDTVLYSLVQLPAVSLPP